MSRLVMHLFGSPHIEVDGAPIEVDTRKATALLAYLAVTGEAHQRDTLANLLWPDYDQSSARAALRRTLSTLNHALHVAPAADGEAGLLEISRESVRLALQADAWLDVREFHQLLASLTHHGHAQNEICLACITTLQSAVSLYPEPFMAGFSLRDSANFEEWQFFQEETLRRELSNALEKLVIGLSEMGQIEAAIQFARRWLALDTLLEEAHRQLMLLYSRADQRNAALRQYRECVRVLEQELGVTPLEETTHLYQAILNRDPLPATGHRLHFVQGPAAVKSQSATAPSSPPIEETAPVAERPLIGRNTEQAQLRSAYNEACLKVGFVALVGEAGIGKTRLADDLVSEARSKGARVLQARCYPGETGLAYAPFIECLGNALRLPDAAARLQSLSPFILAEAARLLPEILSRVPAGAAVDSSLTAVQTMPGEGSQARFFESLRQVLGALLAGPAATGRSLPGVLFLDDLQWADAASLDLLTYLVRRPPAGTMLTLATWRNEPNKTVQALERLAGEQIRAGVGKRLQLARFDPAEVAELVRDFPGAGWQDSERLAQRLYQESEGLPFVAVEYLVALASGSQAEQTDAFSPAENWAIPASVRDLLRSRLASLDEAAQQLFSTAAVIGRSFDDNTLREVSGRSEIETIDGLDQLLVAGLVSEQMDAQHSGAERSQAEIRYDFTHEKMRAMIYDDISMARRRLLHRRVAETLARKPVLRSEQPALIAYHYEQAGLSGVAGEYHLLAGEQARRIYANVEALGHFQAALAAGHRDAAGLHEAIGDLHTLRGEYDAAIRSYQTAAALCTPGCLANLEHKLGNVHQRLGEWDLAESHYKASLESLGEGGQGSFHVHLFADRSLTAYTRGDLDTAQHLARQALELARPLGDAHALAQANNMLGVLARARGDQAEASKYLGESLRAAETLDDPLARIAALNNLALAYGEYDRLEDAIALARQALELCQKRGDRHREAALHNNLADLLHRQGSEDEAMQQLKQAVVIFAEIGSLPQAGQPDKTQAEIWKLTEW